MAVSTTLLVTLVASVLASGPSTATVGDGGSFVPVTPSRIADTATGAGFGSTGSFAAGATKSVKVTGVGGVPASNVGAVVIDVAASSTSDSRFYVYPSNEDRKLATLSAAANQGFYSTTAIVKPGSDGKIKVYNEAGTAQANIDIQGYFTASSTSSSTGGFVPTTPARIVNTLDGTGISTSMTGGRAYSIAVGGKNGIPSDAVGVYANIRAQGATGAGGLRVSASNVATSSAIAPVLNYDTNRSSDTGAAIDLGPDGKFNIYSTSGTTSVDTIIDVQGYFTAGQGGSSFHPISNARVWDSATSTGGALQPRESRTIVVGGAGSIPDDGRAGSLAMGIVVKDWSMSGSVSVFNGDMDDNNGTSNVSFNGSGASIAKQSSAFVQLGDYNEVTVQNNSDAPVSVLLNNQGWFDIPTEQVDTTGDSSTAAQPQMIYAPQTAVITQASDARTFDVTPDLPAGASLVSTSNGIGVSTSAGVQGLYTSLSLDDNGTSLTSSLTLQRGRLMVSVQVPSSAVYPVNVIPSFVPNGQEQMAADIRNGLIEGAKQSAGSSTDTDPNASADDGEVNADGSVVIPDGPSATGEQGLPYSVNPDDRFFTSSNSLVRIPRGYKYHPKRGPHVTLHDFCSYSPDTWRRATFRGPCARHDMCYDYIRKHGGHKTACQPALRSQMQQNCRHAYAVYDPRRSQCYWVAEGYFWTVIYYTMTPFG